MKKNVKKILCALGLAGGISALACNESAQSEIKEICEYLKEQSEIGGLEVTTYMGDTLSIIDKDGNTLKSLPDSFYEELNKKIQEENITDLYFENIRSMFDFSKVDMSTIQTITFENCNDCFFDYSFCCENLQFIDSSEEVIKKVLSESDVKNASVFIKSKHRMESLLSYLVEENICINRFRYKREEAHLTFSEQEFNLLSQLNVSRLSIENDEYDSLLNINLEMNPAISIFSISSYQENVDLGFVRIHSNQKHFSIHFHSFNVTQDTKFCFPEEVDVAFYGDCNYVNPFYDLYDASSIYLKTDLLHYSYYAFQDFPSFMDNIEKSFGNKKGVQKEKIPQKVLNVSFFEELEPDLNDCLIIEELSTEGSSKELSPSFYEKLNWQIASYPETKTLYFMNIDSNCFDFSKINIEALEQLEQIGFQDVSFDCASSFLKSLNTNHYPSLIWCEQVFNESDLTLFLNYLIQNNKTVDEFIVQQHKGRNGYTGITPLELELLSQIKAKSLKVFGEGFVEPIDFNLVLNETVSNFSLLLVPSFSLDAIEKRENSMLGNLSIQSNNKDLTIHIANGIITSSTQFSFPDLAKVELFQTQCADIKPLKDLKNVQSLTMGNTYAWQGAIPGYITYSKNQNDYFYETQLQFFNDFDQMMNFLNDYVFLLRIRKDLNVSLEEDTRYVRTFSIGDVVELYKNDEFYDYRCIYSIIMTKGDISKEVTDMEEYEKLVNEGYTASNYSLVDHYLYLNGNYKSFAFENFLEEDALKISLARVPFKELKK